MYSAWNVTPDPEGKLLANGLEQVIVIIIMIGLKGLHMRLKTQDPECETSSRWVRTC